MFNLLNQMDSTTCFVCAKKSDGCGCVVVLEALQEYLDEQDKIREEDGKVIQSLVSFLDNIKNWECLISK